MKYDCHNPAAARRSLAVLVGLACAFFLASCVASGEVTVGADSLPVPTEPAVVSTAAPTASPAEIEPTPPTRPILVATQVIPRGTLARALVDAPSVYLTFQDVPEDFIVSTAISSMAELAELAELGGLAVAYDVLPGEQLLREAFEDAGINFADAAATPLVEVPAEHQAEVLVLAPSQAVGGLIRAGELVRVIATSTGPDGQAVSISVVDEVEVLGVEAVLLPEATDAAGPRELAVTIALRSDEASRLSAALADSAIITLASISPDVIAVGILLAHDQALVGAARAGNVVHVVALPGPRDVDSEPVVVASDVELLNVSADLANEEPDFYIIASVSDDELLALAAAVANGQIALAEP